MSHRSRYEGAFDWFERSHLFPLLTGSGVVGLHINPTGGKILFPSALFGVLYYFTNSSNCAADIVAVWRSDRLMSGARGRRYFVRRLGRS
eukprot:181897-Amphidinium_carterae.1